MLVLMLLQLPWAVRRNGPALRRNAVTWMQRVLAQGIKACASTNPGSCRRGLFCWAALYAVLGLITGGVGLGAIAAGIRNPLLPVLLAFTVGAWSAALLFFLMAALDIDDNHT